MLHQLLTGRSAMQAGKPAASAEQKRRRTDAAGASASAESPAEAAETAKAAAAGSHAEDAAEELARLRAEVAEKSQLLVVVVQENQRLRTLLANYMAHDNRLMSTSQLSQDEEMLQASQTFETAPLSQISAPGDASQLDAFFDEESEQQLERAYSLARTLSQQSNAQEIVGPKNIASTIRRALSVPASTPAQPPKPVVRVGVGVIILHPLRPAHILVGVRKGSHGAGKLALPGGHLEMNESWADCAIREVKEETNLDILQPQFAYVTNDVAVHGDQSKHYITIFMRGRLHKSSPEPQLMEPEKCEGWRWVSWEDLTNEDPNLLFDPLLRLVGGLNQEPEARDRILAL